MSPAAARDLNEVIRRANPALRETDKVLEILARQNTVLEQLAVNSDTVLAPLARDRARVAGAIRNSSDVAKATAERRGALAADIQTLPEFLDELEPTMVRLGALADESTPVLTRPRRPRAGESTTSCAGSARSRRPRSRPSTRSARRPRPARPAVTDARPVIADLRALAKAVRPVGTNLREVLESFRDTDGIERLMDYIFYQAAAINGFDAVGHYLRAGLIVNQCATYAVRPVAGCSANFPAAAVRLASTATASARSTPPATTRCCGATAIALARALGQEVEKEKTQAADARRPKARRQARSGTRQAPAGHAAAAATPAPDAPARRAARPRRRRRPPRRRADRPRRRGRGDAAPPRRRRRADPADALLDYLFGKDGG